MNRKAFTLLELLIVILIIVVLATLAVPQYINFIEKSRAAEAIRIIRMIATAQDLCKLEHGHFTSVLSELDVAIPSGDIHWEYQCATVPGELWVTATRTANDASPEFIGTRIEMHYYSGDGIFVWSGSHPGTPVTIPDFT